METLLKFLPSAGQPSAVRYGVTIALVAGFFLFSVAVEDGTGREYPFLLMVPVILASILFDRGIGFLATALGVVAAASLMDWRVGVIRHLTVLMFFAILSLSLAAFCEALRKALERGAAAQEELQLLLAEQRHREKKIWLCFPR